MKIRFVINVENQPRTVFGIQETKNGDLNIHTTRGGKRYSAPTMNGLVAVSDEALFEECNTHISVHTSSNSDEHTVVKRTYDYRKRLKENLDIGYQFTTGLKKDNLFIPIIFRIAGDLSRERYKLPQGCKDILINLGSYDPKSDQLRLMVLVSNPSTQFPQWNEHASNYLEYNFSNFRLTVLWSYLNLPSHPQAIDFFLETLQESGPIKGFKWGDIYNLYNDLNINHANSYVQRLSM